MCFGVCITRRGMVYFGASVHIFVTLILFVGSTVRAFRKSTQLRDENRKEMLGAIIIATYFFVLMMLGCLIFRATEQKNSKLLGWTSGVFITLETFAFVFNLLLLSPMGVAYDEYAFRNFGFTVDIFHIVLSVVFLACLLGYCATIVLYISKLKETRNARGSSDYAGYDFEEGAGGPSEGASRTSSRCPSTYFNQRSTMDDKPKLGTLMEVVREAKRAQQQLQHPEQQQLVNKRSSAAQPTTGSSQQQVSLSQVVQAIQPQQQQTRSPPTVIKGDAVVVGTTGAASVSSSETQVKAAETQTPPLPPAMPILHPHSQTLPHPHFYQRRGQALLPEYNVRGPRSSPSYPNVVTASVTPNRFRNPNAGLRTNAAGTLGRYDSMQSSGSHSGSSRTQTLLRQNSSSLSSMDRPIYDPDVQWEQPRVQALKYNYGYNALRRGTHRSDYGMEV